MRVVMATTGPGTPELVDSVTVASSTSDSITFRWNDAEFNDMQGGTYQVRSCALLNRFDLTYFCDRFSTLVMDMEILFLPPLALFRLLSILFLASTVMRQIVM